MGDDDVEEREKDENTDDEEDEGSVEEDEDTDGEAEPGYRDVASAGSSLLTVKPSEKTARVGGVWVDITSENIYGKRKRQSKGTSISSYGGGMSMSIIELMHEIVKEPAPRLSDAGPEGRFSAEAEEFVDACLLKDPEKRKTPGVLLVSSVFSLFLMRRLTDFLSL
jgi:hypothetical protein